MKAYCSYINSYKMKKIYFSAKLSFVFMGLMSVISVAGQNVPVVDIQNTDIEIETGETIAVEATFTDSTGTVQDVNFVWGTDPGYLGKVDKSGILTAGHPGEGKLYAKYRGYRDSVRLVVTGTPKGHQGGVELLPKVKVVPQHVKISEGDSVQMMAFYIDEEGEKTDTTFTWSVQPPELGLFPDPSTGMFFAGEAGTGVIIASLDDMADTVRLQVTQPRTGSENNNSGKQIVISPGDTIVNVGDLASIQYEATLKSTGAPSDGAEVQWSTSGDTLGSIDETTGLFTLSGETGVALITATYNHFRVSVELQVVNPEADSEVNTILFHRVLPDGTELPVRVFHEGDTYKIGGLPFPLNMLNGGMLHFPFGCINEDIVLYMFIPEEYANVNDENSEVSLNDGIITGVKFSVMPVGADAIVEPYYFNTPLNLSLVYKRGLLDSLGITPETLGVFFADNTGFVTDGTGDVAIDTVRNKIYAQIEHFSTIVVRQKNAVTLTKTLESKNNILSVYPNPFRSSTRIEYTVQGDSQIHLAIYNVTGQEVKLLVNEKEHKGTYSMYWNGTNQNGTASLPGIYFCRLIENGMQVQVQRIILYK